MEKAKGIVCPRLCRMVTDRLRRMTFRLLIVKRVHIASRRSFRARVQGDRSTRIVDRSLNCERLDEGMFFCYSSL